MTCSVRDDSSFSLDSALVIEPESSAWGSAMEQQADETQHSGELHITEGAYSTDGEFDPDIDVRKGGDGVGVGDRWRPAHAGATEGRACARREPAERR